MLTGRESDMQFALDVQLLSDTALLAAARVIAEQTPYSVVDVLTYIRRVDSTDKPVSYAVYGLLNAARRGVGIL